MRGQEPGSEHDHREAAGSARPATPPPSFGQTSGEDVPPAFPPSEEADDGETSSVVPVLKGPPPGLSDLVRTDAQPWEVPGDDAAPYDWFADHTDTDPALAAPSRTDPGPSGTGPADPGPAVPAATNAGSGFDKPRTDSPWADPDQAGTSRSGRPPVGPGGDVPQWPAEPMVPGAPPWEPPPAFTAAAAGMPVWPGPAPDPHALPPWPAATGELVAEPDADDQDTPALSPGAAEPQGATRPAHYFDPEAARREAEAAQQRAGEPGTTRPHTAAPTTPPHESPARPIAAPSGISQPATALPPAAPPQSPAQAVTAPLSISQPGTAQPPATMQPSTAQPGAADPAGAKPEDGTRPGPATLAETVPYPTVRRQAAPQETGSTPDDTSQEDAANQSPSREIAHQRPTVPLSAPIAPEREDTRPVTHKDATRPASHDTPHSPHESKGPAHYFDPNAPTPATARPPEPGDVPVWPPHSPVSQKLPDLPFSRDTWGQRPSTALDLPTPPQGSGPAFPPGAFKQPPFQTPPPPPAPQGSSKRALLVTLGALALAGVATGGFFAFQAVSNPTATTAASRGSATPSTPPTEEPEAAPSDAPPGSVLNSEETDPQKLSLSEAFPKKKVSAAGATFTRVKAGIETTCDKAATGAFAEALKEQKCSRVLRATYVDSKRRYAITTGIAVLPTKEAATAVDQAKDLNKNVWFRPLPGAEGSGGERVHIAGGYASGLVWGRYIVFSYATHADGHTPSANEKTLPKVSGAFRDQTSLVLERRATKG
ncbi:hypothetical protein EDD27_10048 [Nonomuraea polychroma]|uniref:Uncharacterized protein n=1 Tax=Nonomuraea polychroma TaxID=46176 RepID=A0A438MNH2_9ACTN|nr:hypothetical protein [Nonomuraea polychroma]RVX47126.1 hypothetical protein EDD27_10048 [Nonomuraea polychroma]